MNRRITSFISSTVLVLLTSPGFAQVTSGQSIETKGLILTRDGDTMTIDSPNHGKQVVAINDETKVLTPKGMFRHNNMEVTSLVPGLEVEVKGTGDANGQIVAEKIEFSKESLRRANQVHAAMTAHKAQTEANTKDIGENQKGISSNAEKIGTNAADISQHSQQIGAVEKRFDDLTEFDVKKQLSVNFPTGKSDIPQEAQQQLAELSKAVQGQKGFLIEVQGFASTSGGADRNQQLSEERAENIVDYLHQQGIPLKNIVNPAAMGTSNPVAGNDTEEDRLKNQRVEVKMLVNRGLSSNK
ncbi:MAG TPA: OmpA family protein [Candidatus Angelobacter sp.]|jgi:outer membrane protein OmpA-like peptidoglycan-associated protein